MSAKTIIRAARNSENPYAQIARAIFEDDRLSWRAKGIMGYLLSRKDDWKVFVGDLQKRSKDGRDACYAGLDELGQAGYLERHEVREKGRIKGYEYVIHEKPCAERSAAWKIGKKSARTEEASGKAASGETVYGDTASGKAVSGSAVSGKSSTSNKELKVITEEESTDKKHLAAGAAACAPTGPEQATESKGSQAVTFQVHPSAGEGTQDTQPAAGEEVPPAPRRAAPSAARRLIEVWNAQRGPLPEVESLNEGRRKAIKKLLRDCGDDLDRAAAVLADAAREVAGDEFWVSRRYGFDNLVPGKVFQKAEAWHARAHRPAAGLPTAPAAAAPAARKDWVNHD